MAFQNKTDYCGLGSVSGLELKSCSTGKSAQFLEKSGANGAIVATEYFGETASPSCEYAVSADVTLSSITLGSGIAFETSKQVALQSVSISTTAGDMPTVSASAVQIENGTTHTEGTVCKFTLPSLSLDCSAHAQDFGAFTLTGTDCVLQDCSLEASADVVTSLVNGVPMASDAVSGKIVVSATIGKYGTVVPTVTTTTGWIQSAPLECSDPDSDFPTYTISFEKILTVTTPVQQ